MREWRTLLVQAPGPFPWAGRLLGRPPAAIAVASGHAHSPPLPRPLASCTTVESLTGYANGKHRALYVRAAGETSDPDLELLGAGPSHGVDADNTLLADLEADALRGRELGIGVGLREAPSPGHEHPALRGSVAATLSSSIDDVDLAWGWHGGLGVEFSMCPGARLGTEYRYVEADYGRFDEEGMILLRLGFRY